MKEPVYLRLECLGVGTLAFCTVYLPPHPRHWPPTRCGLTNPSAAAEASFLPFPIYDVRSELQHGRGHPDLGRPPPMPLGP